MSPHIAGMVWVTPLGSGMDHVWGRLLNGEMAKAEGLSSSLGRTHSVFRVPAEATAQAPAHPRLRRSSAISRFAVVAGLAALEDAKLKLDAETAARTALIFAVSNGGVIYTKKFYHEIVESGAKAASPLLFPETVFNAPASHLAAILGINGASYTLVGDGAVGILALKMAEDLMLGENFDHCLVVGAEEADWLLCDAYRRWRLLRSTPPIEPFHNPAKGTILSEGAGAVLLGRSGSIRIEKTHPGNYYGTRREAGERLRQILAELGAGRGTTVISGANGTFIDLAEVYSISEVVPSAMVYTPKPSLGEGVGAGSIWQVIIGAQALRTHQLPPLLHAPADLPFQIPTAFAASNDVIILSCGLNQQVAGLRLSN